MKKYKNGALALVLAVSLSACGINHGDRMDYNLINSIQRGVTTEAQIRSMFGEPVSVQTNQKLGIKKLVYAYRNDDSMKKSAAGLGGWKSIFHLLPARSATTTSPKRKTARKAGASTKAFLRSNPLADRKKPDCTVRFFCGRGQGA